jgi:dihydrofolate synthase/folylpolyglutamate synthase
VNYRDSLGKLLSLTDLERVSGRVFHVHRYDLTRVEALLSSLENPHLATPTIHIAGTKGKGSTAALVSSALSAQGYRVGLYTSPHLHSFRERIQFLGSSVSEDAFASLVKDIWPIAMELNRKGYFGDITTFEFLTAMAFTYFRNQSADIQVIEVGLGGRLDSTNVVIPEVCAITSISYDHTDILGDTLDKIATEKAGIVKPGSTVVVSPQPPQAAQAIQKICDEAQVTSVSVDQEYSWVKGETNLQGQFFEISTRDEAYHFWIPLLGHYQLENAATALAILQAMNQRGFIITKDAIAQGFRSVKWPGRLEVISKAPLLVVDGAHNPYSARQLMRTVQEYFKFRRVIGLVGILADKNLEEIPRELATGLSLLIATRSRHPRSASPAIVATAFSKLGLETFQVDTTHQGLSYALGLAKEDDLILATGSLFVAAEVRESALGIPGEVYPSLLPGEPSSFQRSVHG